MWCFRTDQSCRKGLWKTFRGCGGRDLSFRLNRQAPVYAILSCLKSVLACHFMINIRDALLHIRWGNFVPSTSTPISFFCASSTHSHYPKSSALRCPSGTDRDSELSRQTDPTMPASHVNSDLFPSDSASNAPPRRTTSALYRPDPRGGSHRHVEQSRTTTQEASRMVMRTKTNGLQRRHQEATANEALRRRDRQQESVGPPTNDSSPVKREKKVLRS